MVSGLCRNEYIKAVEIFLGLLHRQITFFFKNYSVLTILEKTGRTASNLRRQQLFRRYLLHSWCKSDISYSHVLRMQNFNPVFCKDASTYEPSLVKYCHISIKFYPKITRSHKDFEQKVKFFLLSLLLSFRQNSFELTAHLQPVLYVWSLLNQLLHYESSC